jgi:dynein heavy chain, axonemal
MREFANAPDTNSKWIILDGDLDANWIESMNSVMDDNKLLTLASNERIVVKGHMKLVFEIRDLKFATPATASRAGISFITSKKSQWMSYMQSWVAAREEDTDDRKQLLLGLFGKYIDESLLAMNRDFKHMAPILDFNIVQTLCNILQGLLTQENCPKGKDGDDVTVETYFVFAAIWAFGSAFSITDGIDYRKNFSAWWKSKWSQVKLPTKGQVFDFFVEKGTLKWVAWAQIVEKIDYVSTTSMDAVTVPTGETVSIAFYLELLVELKKPALMVGLAGAGKTALVNGKLRSLPEDYNTCVINYNFYTGSTEFQAVMEGQLEKKAGKNYGPPGVQKLVYFVDDLNMPQLDDYDTSTAISLLRQYMEYQHWYDLAKLQLRIIQNCQFLCAMNPTCGSFIINPRLQRHFMVFAIGFPGQEALMTIFSTFLNGHINEFDPKISDQQFQNKVIQAALELHDKVSKTFRKTAANFHYEFSIRHLANVFKGLLMSESSFFPSPDKFAALFVHEAERVYGDRLVSPAHLTEYLKLAKDTGKKFFKDQDQAQVFPNPHIFCNCWKDLDEKSYNKVDSMEKLGKILGDALNAYNETNAAMNLVLFDDAMKHLCRICRIIQSGHALLVGVGGSGKQSLTRLASFISGCSVSQIVLSGTYGMNEFKEDIKQMYMKAGVKGEPICFLFTDSQIAHEKFLVYMNELLSSGKIPNLFAADEVDGIYGAVRNEGKAEGVVDAKDPMYDFFISKVKRNLHVCLCFSPVGAAFGRRASRFPSLINCTVIDWFQPWPDLALYDVAKRFLSDVELGEGESRESIIKFMPFSFGKVNEAAVDFKNIERRFNYTTPKSFLELIYLYMNMLEAKRKTLFGEIDKLSNGLDKLEKTQKDVAILEEEIKVKSVEVEAAKANADEIAEKVGGEKTKVEAAAAGANEEAAKCSVIAESAGKMQVDCERDLAAAVPAVEKAEKALDGIDKKGLQELKALGKPPGGVSDVTDAILALKGVPKKQWTWQAAQQMMKDVDKFIQVELANVSIYDSEGLSIVNSTLGH